MALQVPLEFETFIQNQVALGRFPSPQDVIAEALRRLQCDEEFGESLVEADAEFAAGGGIDGNAAHQIFRETAAKVADKSR
jgi:Arc/MetJ-type ribon-helix-helix transcriptional regulator